MKPLLLETTTERRVGAQDPRSCLQPLPCQCRWLGLARLVDRDQCDQVVA